MFTVKKCCVLLRLRSKYREYGERTISVCSSIEQLEARNLVATKRPNPKQRKRLKNKGQVYGIEQRDSKRWSSLTKLNYVVHDNTYCITSVLTFFGFAPSIYHFQTSVQFTFVAVFSFQILLIYDIDVNVYKTFHIKLATQLGKPPRTGMMKVVVLCDEASKHVHRTAIAGFNHGTVTRCEQIPIRSLRLVIVLESIVDFNRCWCVVWTLAIIAASAKPRWYCSSRLHPFYLNSATIFPEKVASTQSRAFVLCLLCVGLKSGISWHRCIFFFDLTLNNWSWKVQGTSSMML